MVGEFDVAKVLLFWISSEVLNLIQSTAVPLLSAFAAMARLWPPRLDTPGPVMPGSGATSNLPLTTLSFAVWDRLYM